MKTNCIIQADDADIVLFLSEITQIFFTVYSLITSIFALVYAGYLHPRSPLMVLSYWFSSKLLAWSVCYWLKQESGASERKRTREQFNLY